MSNDKEYPIIVSDEYVISPCNNQFNKKVSYWISKRDITIAFYCFSVSTYGEVMEMLKNKNVIDSYIKMFDDRVCYAAKEILSRLQDSNKIKIRDLLALDIDVDIYNDVTEEVAPAFCGAMNITESGITEFADVLDIYGALDKDEKSFTVLIDQFYDWEKTWNAVDNFFTCAAGYCDCNKWDEWFGDDEIV